MNEKFSTDTLDELQRIGFVPSKLLPNNFNPSKVNLLRVNSISRVKEVAENTENKEQIKLPTSNLLTGLHGRGIPIGFLITATPGKVEIHFGVWNIEQQSEIKLSHDIGTLEALLDCSYPAIKTTPEQLSIQNLPLGGFALGVPSFHQVKGQNEILPIDRIIYAMSGTWSCLILAYPTTEMFIQQIRKLAINQLRLAKNYEQVLGTQAPLVEYYNKIMEGYLKSLTDGLAVGCWRTGAFLLGNKKSYHSLSGIWRSVFSGKDSQPDAIRVYDSKSSIKYASHWRLPDSPKNNVELTLHPFEYQSVLNSTQLANYIHLPGLECPGFQIRDTAIFDVARNFNSNMPNLSIGEIYDRGKNTGNSYRVLLDDLTRHALITGITGSGKTTTLFNILRELSYSNPPIPFLIIEPAKREYRKFWGVLPEDLQPIYFTLGEESPQSAPFRFNPFEIRPGVSVQTHIDLLKSVFISSFSLWPPLPQVLERAIYEIYSDRGWDITGGHNRFLTNSEVPSDEVRAYAQPTMTDLYQKVTDLVPKLGYDGETTRNIKSALETRLNSLRIGAKGLMLDTSLSIPMTILVKRPVVLELDGIGDDEEKAFVIGLIMISLYEYYRVSNKQPDNVSPKPTNKLRHITVVEEAHRLLENVQFNSNPEVSNVKGKAVETFVNMLSEIRSYGEGFIIAEQIPTKLAPDVIKNSSLKILHRIVANDDREAMGGAMNLTPRQLRQVVALNPGEAIVHSGGDRADDNPMFIKIDNKKLQGKPISDLRTPWRHLVSKFQLKPVFRVFHECTSLCRPLDPSTDKKSSKGWRYAVCSEARKISEIEDVKAVFSATLLTILSSEKSLDNNELIEIMQPIRVALSGYLKVGEPITTSACAVTHILHSFLRNQAVKYAWPYKNLAIINNLILPALRYAVVNQELSEEDIDKFNDGCREYLSICTIPGPFYGCEQNCGDKCLFRFSVADRIGNDVKNKYKKLVGHLEESTPDKIKKLANEHVMGIVLPDINGEIDSRIKYCFIVQCFTSNPNINVDLRKRFLTIYL